MGFIQGLTEFLPVSSSGHLAIFKNILNINLDTGMFFDIMLHLGTLIAVFIAFRKDIWRLIVEGVCIVIDFFYNIIAFFRNLFTKAGIPYRRIVRSGYRKFVMLVIVSTIPTGIIGYLARDIVETAASVLIVPGICLLITGILLLIADVVNDGHKRPKDVTYTNAFAVGICQGIATLPGLSRSGTTITACLLSGFDRRFAVKYSFIMSIPAILGASLLEVKDVDFGALKAGELINYGIGTLVAAVVGYICIKTMLVVVRKKKFKIFAIYCFLLGIISVVGFFFFI